jgi:amino acid adenylation domain-containing protein
MGNFAQAMTDMQVNTTFLTPSVVRLIQPDQVPTLKTLILGGEALGQDNITVWADKLKLMNGYGPTETCVFCIMNTFDTTKDRADVLGRAVSSVSWIVSPDNDNRLAPVGSVGTLLVQGPTLARGYLGDEKKTAQVFINAPAWLPNEAGTPTKLYKTGDLARYNSDGSITYLGRQDTQVKLRGQRIELAEIEHHVKDKLACAQQVGVEVIVPQGVKEKATLAAFLSLVDQPKETSGELFGEISESLKSQLLALQKDLIDVLPPYEIPTLYIPFRRMPTTTAGKLDRRAVRDAASQLSEAQLKAYSLVDASSKRKPETAMEKTMQKLWSDILKVSQDQIGADDSFFRLGGDSIMAMRLTATASAADISLSVSEIFRNVTLSEMAAVAVESIPESNIGEPIGPFQLIPHVRSIEDIGLIAEQCNVEATQVEDAYPCTALQEGLMALSIVKPGAYVGQKIFQFPASMDISRFKNAWEVTFNAHPILRTRIIQTEGLGSLQVVLKEEIAWKSADSLEVYLQHDKEDRIAYGKRLTRYGIVTAKEGYYFIWTAHHAMYDGWSLPLILEQVQQAYEHNLCTEAAGFNTFIKYLASTDPEASAQFWKEQFSGEKPTSFPQLPTASHQVHTNEQLTHSVRISRKTGSAILMSTVLRAAWAMVLAKYADVQDVVFGVTLSGRNAPVAGVDKMLGPTITTVPVRIQFQQSRTVAQLLEEVQRQATEMIPHEQFGLQKISHLSEEAAHAVNFQNLLVIQPVSQFQTHGQEAMGAKEISLPLEDFDTYPLIMECSLSDNKVDIEMRFDSNVLPNHQIQRMLHHFEHIVWQLNDESNTIAVEDIDMFSQEDQNQISEWNRDYPEVVEDVVVSAFVEQVMARPEALAVDAWDGKFTYGELDVLSTKLAHYLVALGVGPEVLVPLCFDKSRWAILTQLSIMKAGGACVNLDPAHPLARLELIIQDSNAKVLLCAPQHAHLFESAGPQVVTIQQSLLNELPEKPKTQLPVIHPNNTAYVLFTSGSTGKPKGIVIEHGSLATSSKAHGTRWEIGPETRLLQFAAYTFDVSCADIFTSLQRGACICVPSEHDRMNDLAGAINKFRCNWAFLTPTVAGLLPAEGIPTLKKLVLGGEASTRDTIAKWHNVLDLIVCYGPAETSIYCSGAPPAKKDSDPANLGQAIGALYWIANPANHEKLTPVGCVGELLLEGRTVARGYLHDEVKTSAAFIQNPSWLPSASINGRPRRLYKTGDLVRYNSDGTIRFVGRKDTQTKVRGQRVELGEIEHAIRQNLPKLAHVIVDAVRLNERQAVVAFLHTTSDTHDENGTQAMPMDPEMRSEMISLQRALTESLPSYMIPNMFIPLSHVPLTMNGKADRRKLRELASSLTREQALIYSLEDAIKQEPTTEMEFKLRELWAQVIKVDATTIGAGDHFFRLGGDSILAMRLVGIAKSEGIQLTVGDVFRRPILADMASSAITVDQKTEIKLEAYKPFSLMEVASVDALVSDISAQIGRKEEEIADVLPATDFQQLAAVHAMLKTRGMLNYMFLDGDRKAPLDVELMESACKQMVKQNDILRTVFAPVGTDFVQVVLADPEISFQVYETFEDMESFSDNLCKEDLKAPLRLGDLFVKFMVVKKFRSSQHRLVMRISHAQYDGLSLPEMWKSLQGAFNGATSSEQSTSTPFSTYLTAAASIKTTESYQYWKDLLAGSTMTQIVAHSKPAYSNEYDSNIKRTIPNPSLGSSGATFASLLKAAWAVVLANATGKSDIVFGHVISGRNIPNSDADKIVGPCLNIVPVRVNLASSSTGLDLLNQVQEQQVSNIPFEFLGFREITRSCTSWPSYTRFSSIVQHQNIDENWNISLGNAEYEIGNFCPGADEADLAIKSTPRGDQVEVQMVSSTKSVPAAVAEELLEKLCETIVEMAKSPEMQLPSENQLRKVEKKLPLSLPSLMSYNTDVTMPIDSVDIDNERGENIRKKVKAAWMQVLGSSEKEDFKIADNSSLFDCGGDLISVAALSVKLGVEVESLIDRDTLEEQVRMFMGLEFAKNGSLLKSVKSLGSRFRSYFC